MPFELHEDPVWWQILEYFEECKPSVLAELLEMNELKRLLDDLTRQALLTVD